jgi:hypothetical protein
MRNHLKVEGTGSDWIRQSELDLAPTVIIRTCSAFFRRPA